MVSALTQQNSLLISTLTSQVSYPATPSLTPESAELGEESALFGSQPSTSDGGAALIGAYESALVDIYA